MIRGDPDVVKYFVSLSGLVVTLIATAILGQLESLLVASLFAVIAFAVFGAFHFGLSRFLAYESYAESPCS